MHNFKRPTTDEQIDEINQRGREKHGFGALTDHYGTLTGEEGKTIHPLLHPELMKLRSEMEGGHLSAAQHAAAVEKLLSASPPERVEYDTRKEGTGKIPPQCLPPK
jgi:hypothetical protein